MWTTLRLVSRFAHKYSLPVWTASWSKKEKIWGRNQYDLAKMTL